ncbi:L-threonylcarbamoyladenylate synthase [Moraxella bovoculi]|uniref:L-threonylcarbamoyladenylate synthase n=1 Tax=Moraxella bovoculi TaxID=386891 RepID=UPI003F507A46
MCEPKIFNIDQIPDVVNFLRLGGVLAYPSESVWGLGCDAFNTLAIERIFELKSRPEHKGLIVLTDSTAKVAPLLQDLPQELQSDVLQKLQKANDEFDARTADQAQTYLMPVSKLVKLPKILTGGFDTLAVRVTHHLILAQICNQLTNPENPFGFLVSTSCNISGAPSATTINEAMAYFGSRVAYLNTDGLGFTKPSQIIDLMTGDVLR